MAREKVGEIKEKAITGGYEEEKKKKIKEFRTEASRLASMANKRIKRLENAGLTDSPAYKKYIESGGAKFSVRGKDHNELQKEVARMNQFLNSKTSTIRGVNNVLKEMADNTGMKYKNLTELKQKAGKFFELASKVEQYLRTVDDMASAIGYQKIWTAVNNYTDELRGEIDLSNMDIDRAIFEIGQAITEYEKKETIYSLDNAVEGWFTLKRNEED